MPIENFSNTLLIFHRPPKSKYMKLNTESNKPKKKLYVIESFFEWIFRSNFEVLKIFRKRLKEIARECSRYMKYVIMSSSPNDQ